MLLVGVFAAGLARLLDLRLRTGDVYPRGSSLRGDPQGTKVLFTALDQIGLATSRNRDPNPSRALGGRELTLLVPALDPCELLGGSSVLAATDTLVRRGARAIVLLDEQGLTCLDGGREGPELLSRKTRPGPGLLEHWGLWVGQMRGEREPSQPAVRDALASDELPERLRLPGPLAFTGLSPDWSVVYRRHQRPVAIQRRLGQGTLVVLSSTYPLTNQAMLEARSSALVWWLLGGRRAVVFDEVHLGVAEERGVVHLASSLGLLGGLGGLLVVFALLAWRGAAPFCPRRERAAAQAPAGGAPPELVALLTRAVPPRELVTTCVHERLATLRERERARLYFPALAGAADPRAARDIVPHFNGLVRLFSERHRP